MCIDMNTHWNLIIHYILCNVSTPIAVDVITATFLGLSTPSCASLNCLNALPQSGECGGPSARRPCTLSFTHICVPVSQVPDTALYLS